MSAPAAIQGSYADLRFVKSRNVAQVTIEIPLEAASAFVEAFGTPNPSAEVPVALARIRTSVYLPDPPKQIESKRIWQDMPAAQQAGIRCAEPEFQRFLAERFTNTWAAAQIGGDGPSQSAAQIVRWQCGVKSRSEFAINAEAVRKWDALDADYYAWQRGAR